MAKPVIGMNCDLDIAGVGRAIPKQNLFVYADYVDAVVQAGGIPLLLPFLEDEADIRQVLAGLDGLLLIGGGDVDPSLYGRPLHPATRMLPERRLRFDLSLAAAALTRKTPILGVCMGMQLLNVAAGGTLVQHLEDTAEDRIKHQQMARSDQEVHEISISADSRLAKVMQAQPLAVNSTHHQAIDRLAPGFKVCARAADGVIEAIERTEGTMVLGVQWHPERLTQHARHLSLFEALMEEAPNED